MPITVVDTFLAMMFPSMTINSRNNDITLIELLPIEQDPSRDDQQEANITLDLPAVETTPSVTPKTIQDDDTLSTLETSCWSKYRFLMSVCALILFTIIAMTIGVMTVCLTAPEKTNGTCQLTFKRSIKRETVYDSHPQHVSIGDFNKDGHLDLVVANSGTDCIGIFLGYGNGTFANQITYSTGLGSHPYFVATGDFNNDTIIDVVVANYGINSIGVLLGYDNGSFASPVITSLASSRPLALAIEDFNKDQQLDIAVVSNGTSNVAVLIGVGNGSFRIETAYEMGYDSLPYSLAIADFNNDKQLDIAVVNYGTSTLCILIRNGNGTFISFQYSTGNGSHPSSVAVGDINKDNQLDIAVANLATGTVVIFLGNENGNGTFGNIIINSIDSHSRPQFIVLADLNNDTNLDMIIADSQNDNVYVLRGDGSGNFRFKTTHSTGYNSHPCSIIAGDFDNNSSLGVALTNSAINNILVLTEYFVYPNTNQVTYPAGNKSAPIAVAVGDFNDDNHLDIVVGYWSSYFISIFLNLGNGTFGREERYETIENDAALNVVVGDLNNDNHLDIAFALYRVNKIGILLGFGNGTFRYGNFLWTGEGSGPILMVIGDFNNDTNLDIVPVNSRIDNVVMFLGYGDGTFTNIITILETIDGQDFYTVDMGDFNNDNILDIFVGGFYEGGIYIFLGHGNGSFRKPLITSNDNDVMVYVAMGDLNKDHRLDVVYVDETTSIVGVFLGHGNGTFGNVTRYSTGNGVYTSGVALGYFNDDAFLDIAVVNTNDYNLGIFLGYGNGSFAPQQLFSTGYNSYPNALAFGDFDNDKQSDIVVTNSGPGNIGIFLVYYDADFSSETNYLTGSGPHPSSVVVGDFNNDSQQDMVVSNSGNDNIQILLHYDKGAFMDNVTYSTGFNSYPYSVTATDFNKDKQLDIAVVNYWKDNINVFIGHGNGTFDTPTVHSTGANSFPSSIAFGDFNKDSWMDVVVTNQGANNVGVFLGLDYATFTSQTIDAPGNGPTPIYVAVGDVNNDHYCDMIVANFDKLSVGIFLGYGNGTFAKQISYSTPNMSSPISIAVGDLNNDNQLDFIVANRDADNIGVFLGYGNGSFKTPILYFTGNYSSPTSVVLRDFNRDNILDIAVANRDTANIGIFIGYGNGIFAEQIQYLYPNGSLLRWVAVDDFNNDNILDLVVASRGGNSIGIFFGYGDGTFNNVTTYSTGDNSGPYSIGTGDFNNDIWIDIAVANRYGQTVSIFFASGNGTFSPQITYSTGPHSYLYSLTIGDFNNDTILDIGVADWGNGDGNVGIFYGSGDGKFAALKKYSTGLNSDPTSIAICDFNNDNRLDFAVTNTYAQNISIMLRYGSEFFAEQTTFPTDNDSFPTSVSVGDFNNDDQLDIAVANSGTNNVGILLGYRNGSFTNQLTYSTGTYSYPSSIVVGNFNNDHYLDIAVLNFDTNNVGIMLGYGNGMFPVIACYSTGQSSAPSSIAIADLNKDNQLDLIIANWGINNILIFFGLGNATFSNPKSYSVGYSARPQSITIGDINNDNLLDIAVANYGTDYVEVLLQTC